MASTRFGVIFVTWFTLFIIGDCEWCREIDGKTGYCEIHLGCHLKENLCCCPPIYPGRRSSLTCTSNPNSEDCHSPCYMVSDTCCHCPRGQPVG